jgi:anti-sigma regulatory factor (Ser/Thr protein kinase)
MNALRRNLPRTPGSIRTARQLVNDNTITLGSQRREDAALMVSELVTNALVHGVGTISLRIDAEAPTLRVEVSDEGNVALAPSPTPGAHGGWGLRIIDQLADDWGVLEGSTKGVVPARRAKPTSLTGPALATSTVRVRDRRISDRASEEGSMLTRVVRKR